MSWKFIVTLAVIALSIISYFAIKRSQKRPRRPLSHMRGQTNDPANTKVELGMEAIDMSIVEETQRSNNRAAAMTRSRSASGSFTHDLTKHYVPKNTGDRK